MITNLSADVRQALVADRMRSLEAAAVVGSRSAGGRRQRSRAVAWLPRLPRVGPATSTVGWSGCTVASR